MYNQNPALTSMYIQRGGPGNPFEWVDAEAIAAAYSGGGAAFESDYSQGEYIGSRVTQNKARTTLQVSARSHVRSALRDVASDPTCLPGLMVLSGCPPQYMAKWAMLRYFVDAGIAGNGISGNIADLTSIADPKLMDQINMDAGEFFEGRPVAHSDISLIVNANANVSHILRVGKKSCPGQCGPGATGQEEFIAVGGPVSPATAPRIYYTPDGGNTWVQTIIAASAIGVAEWVALAGNTVVIAVSGTNGGLFVGSFAALKAGTFTAQLANGITAGHIYNSVVALDDSTVLACGASGRIALSVDGGFSFTLLGSPVATALNVVDSGIDKNLAWIGGASGVVIRVKNLSVAEQVTVTGLSTDAVNALAVPRHRTAEVYIGTATGKIFRSRNGYDSRTTWEEKNFVKPTAGGIIEYLEFIPNSRQAQLAILQSNASTQTRLLIDLTGGDLGAGVIEIGDFTSPPNTIINAVAMANQNYGLTVGAIDNALGFFGRIAG